jgi:xylan 1,4-beta-xylosidase
VVSHLEKLNPGVIRLVLQEYFQMMEAPGKYNWEKVDRAVEAIVRTGAKPILTISMKPPCIFPEINQKITEPTNWKDWEDFIEAMVHHFAGEQNWKGIWYEIGTDLNRGELWGSPYIFTADGYAEFYARTAKSILRGDPTAKVGGPGASFWTRSDYQMAEALVKRVKTENLPFDFYSFSMSDVDSKRLLRHITTLKGYYAKSVWKGPFASAPVIVTDWSITDLSIQAGEFLQGTYIIDTIVSFIDAGIKYSCYDYISEQHINTDKWQGWFSHKSLDFLRNYRLSEHKGTYLMTENGEVSASYLALSMLYGMDGEKNTSGHICNCLKYLATKTDNSCSVLLWNYDMYEIGTIDIDVRIDNLPEGKARCEYYVLGNNLLASITGARKGRLPVFESKGLEGLRGSYTKQLTVKPYSIHLIKLTW